jgi:hypothetical protein
LYTGISKAGTIVSRFQSEISEEISRGFQRKNMKYWQRFSTYKQRGEWAELKFMTEAAQRRFGVSKPWGDTRAYDVGVEHGQNFLRVQVKSTSYRVDAGYRCKFVPEHISDRDYSLHQLDLFAAYVIPEEVWYLIPAVLLVGKRRKSAAMLCPVTQLARKPTYRYECYREGWNLLTRSRRELLQYVNE